MEWKDIVTLIEKGNTNESRFFGSISSHDVLGPTLVAMANTKGGHIVIGFDLRNYHLLGTSLDRHWVELLLKQYCNPVPKVDVEFIEKNEKVIMLLTITQYDQKPYYYKNKCYVMDTQKTTLSLMEKEEVFSEGDGHVEDSYVQRSDVEDQELNSEEKEDLNKITDELMTLNGSESEDDSHEFIMQDQVGTVSFNEEPSLFKKESEKESVEEPSSTESSTETGVGSLNERQQKAVKYLAAHQEIKNKVYRELFNVSHKTAHLELVDLVEKNLILSKGSGRSTCYVLNAPIQQRLM